MSYFKNVFCSVFFLCVSFNVFAEKNNIEKIIIIRHAEKPFWSLGQLNCKGLNRSLMLPGYFHKHFEKPDYIFAPNPAVKNWGYSYVRALATIEPTAIRLGMPVSTQIGYNQADKMAQTLLEKKYHHATIIVSWEHNNIVKIVDNLFEQFNAGIKAPAWSNSNYNMVFVITIDWNQKPAKLNFAITSEDFKNISSICPDD